GSASSGPTRTSRNPTLPPPCGTCWSGYCMRIHRLEFVIALLAPLASGFAQPAPEIKQILERLDRLESENRELREQVRQLHEQVSPAPARLEERLAIEERRTEEVAQTKIEASQRFPIRLTGMALVNAFYNAAQNGGSDN